MAGEASAADAACAHAVSLLSARDLPGWRAFAPQPLGGGGGCAGDGAARAFVALSLRVLQSAASGGAGAFAAEAAAALLAALGGRPGAAGAELRAAAGDGARAAELWRAELAAGGGGDAAALRAVARLARGGWATEAECLRGLALTRALATRRDAAAEVDGFLRALAELLAARGRPAEAAQRFHELHTRTAALVPLRRAAVCALITDAGPARLRLLAAIDREEAAERLGELRVVLTRARRGHLLRREDAQRLMPFVEPPADAEAVEAAFVQHNVLAISQFYDNIGFTQLAGVLGIAPDEAERVVARMVSERRLHARIDQTTETVFFGAPGNAGPLHVWDAKIATVCKEVSCATDQIISLHPEYSEYVLLH